MIQWLALDLRQMATGQADVSEFGKVSTVPNDVQRLISIAGESLSLS